MKWTPANEFQWEPRTTYCAKWVSRDNNEVKATGWFQESDGTFFWKEQGLVPVPKKDHDKFLILDETEQASPDAKTLIEALESLLKHAKECQTMYNISGDAVIELGENALKNYKP